MNADTYGGSFVYHFGNNLVSYGFVIGLDYANPYLSPFEEMQRFKTHPDVRGHFEGGRRISYGARALNEGGLQSIPTLTFPGGALIGDSAGFVNVAKIKGTHTSMKTGMLAAEAVIDALAGSPGRLTAYSEALRDSWVWDELVAFATSARHSPNGGCGVAWPILRSTLLFRGRAPWTFHHAHADNETLMEKAQVTPIEYPRPDGKLTFDRLSSVFISNTNHEENQPPHLQLDPKKAIAVNSRSMPVQKRGIVRPAFMKCEECRSPNCGSMRRTACTAKPATSRIPRKTSTGWCRRAAVAPVIPAGCRATADRATVTPTGARPRQGYDPERVPRTVAPLPRMRLTFRKGE